MLGNPLRAAGVTGLIIGAFQSGHAYFGNPLEHEAFLAEGVSVKYQPLVAQLIEAIKLSEASKRVKQVRDQEVELC